MAHHPLPRKFVWRSQWFFVLAQVGAITWAAVWLFGVPPSPGYAVAVLAVAAAVMSVNPDMQVWQKGLWMLVIGAFLVVEFRAIDKDRKENNESQAKIRKDDHDSFERIGRGIDTAIQNNQEHFDTTIKRSDALYKAESKTSTLALKALHQTEGGDGYCYLTTAPPVLSRIANNAPWSMIATCVDKDKLPVVDVLVLVQEALSDNPSVEEIDSKLWHGPHFNLGTLPSGGFVPTDIELKPGKYNISIYSRKSAVLEQLYFAPRGKTVDTWNEQYCVYKYQTNELLSGNKECRNPR